MTTPTELANMALAHLGQARISDFSERSPAAEHCRRAFDHVRRLCLRDYDWNFAIRRATLTAAEATPEFDWGYEYPLPSDCLRVISVNQRPGGTRLTDYAVEGRAILSNSADCRVRYIRDVTDPTLWDSMFSSYFCYRLAAAIAPSLRLDPAAGQQMEQMAAAIRDQAREADAVESEPRVTRLDQSEMIEDREGRWGPGTASGGGSTPEATVINLTGAGTATTYTITPSGGGSAVEIPSATVSAAGVMTAAQVSLLASRAPTADPTFAGTVTAPHIHGNLAGAVYTHIRNGSGATLTKGTPVQVTGYHPGSDRPLVGPADAASDSTMPCIGILDADVANNADGHAVVLGLIENLNTAGYAVNQRLYIASGGGLTGTAPAVRAQSVAIVERVNANTGAILVTASDVTGSMASQSAGAVAITGGTIQGITDLAVADGGTGASTAAGARVNLDVPSVGDLDAQRVDIQTFGGPNTSGSFTWVKPANAKLILVRIIGAGSGGASGICRATSVLRTGGGGGAGGAAAIQLIPAADLPASVAVTVGAGTAGGIGTNNPAANHANALFGGPSFFGNYRANGGGSTNGTTAATGLSGSVFSLLAAAAAGNGGAGNTTGGAGVNAAIQPSHFIATGGGGGASAAAGNTTGANGGSGGDRLATAAPLGYGVLLAGGTGGVSGGAVAGAGNNQDQSIAAGTGGGGGAYATGANGGNGGNGGWPGGGGGGGGAADDGFTAGSGGRGANGFVQVITYF